MEVAFIPQKIADRLKEYIQTADIDSESKIFPISYTAAWSIVVKAGKLVGIHLRPHVLLHSDAVAQAVYLFLLPVIIPRDKLP